MDRTGHLLEGAYNTETDEVVPVALTTAPIDPARARHIVLVPFPFMSYRSALFVAFVFTAWVVLPTAIEM
ncbi:hypothetical protein AGMMS49579_08450 [Spirochaetia bacterium]|nr:hypothetical protein AGMMS49579_08450 [Spirochaetia bacterium]